MSMTDKEFIDYYTTHSTASTKKFFNLTEKPFNDLLIQYGIEKHDRATNIKFTNIEKYGCENVFQLSSVKDKASTTKLNKYGSKTYNNPNAREQTCLHKYGTVSASGNDDIKNKIKSTNIERYGVENPFQDVDKIKQSCIDKYGSVENFNKYCEERRQESLLEKYGVINSSQIPNTRDNAEEKRRLTCLSKYGVESATLLPQCKASGYSAESKPNKQFSELLNEYGYIYSDVSLDNPIYYSHEFPIQNRSYDFKIGNILIEINPFATHNSTWAPHGDKWVKPLNYHYEKSKLARDNGYRCICVWDWDDIDKIINLLKPKEKIYARKCILKEVGIKDAKSFINAYHLQGYAKDEIRLGLYYEDNLVSIMTFGRPRYNKKYEYELIRYCSSKNIIGGSEKLFKYFINKYNPNSIISYCDYSKFNGDTYIKLGFEYNDVTIGRHWYNPKSNKHITDNLLRQRGFDQLFGTNYGKGTSNEELMLTHGFVKIYDCGQASYIWVKK